MAEGEMCAEPVEPELGIETGGIQLGELPATKLDSVFDPRWESMCRIGERNLDPPILDVFTKPLQRPSDFRRLAAGT